MEIFNERAYVCLSNAASVPRPNGKAFPSAASWHPVLNALEVGVLFGFMVGAWAAGPYGSMGSPGVADALPLLLDFRLFGFDGIHRDVGEVFFEGV